jgi:hypothetical protein
MSATLPACAAAGARACPAPCGGAGAPVRVAFAARIGLVAARVHTVILPPPAIRLLRECETVASQQAGQHYYCARPNWR